MQPTLEQLHEVERQVNELCDASGVSRTDAGNAQLHNTNTYIQVHLTHKGSFTSNVRLPSNFSWVLRFRYRHKGKVIPKPTLFQVLLDEDNGELVPSKLINGSELPWGYT